MPKVVAMMSLSLDGFYADPDGGLEWSMVDEELHQHHNDWLRPAGGFVDGRVTYELMKDYWPGVLDDPSAEPVMADFAAIWRDVPKIVYSTTLPEQGGNVTVLRSVVADDVEAMKARADGDLILGGGVLTAAFAELGLVDEYRLYIHPTTIGTGKRYFADPRTAATLRLVETGTFASGVVMLRYAVPPNGDA